MEIFWNTIAKYNENTWWAQIIITATGIVLTTLLYHKPTVRTKRSMKLHGVPQRLDSSGVLYDVLQHTQLPPHTRHFLGNNSLDLVVGPVYGLYPIRAQSQISNARRSALCNAFSLSPPLMGAWNGISYDDDNRNALLGSSIYYRIVTGFLAQG